MSDNNPRVDMVYTRYHNAQFIAFAVLADEDSTTAKPVIGLKGDLKENQELFFVYVLYTVAVGPYSFAGQYHLYKVFASKDKAKEALEKVKAKGEVPDGIIYQGDPELDNVYIVPAKYATKVSKDLMDAQQHKMLDKKSKEEVANETTRNHRSHIHGGVPLYSGTGGATRREKRVATANRRLPTNSTGQRRRTRANASSGRRKTTTG